MKKRSKMLYILSPSFSGSTLLTLILAQFPRVATIGELKATAMGEAADYTCSCGERLFECTFWKALSERLREQGVPFSFENFGTQFDSGNPLFGQILRAQCRGDWFEACRRWSIALVPGLNRTFTGISEQNRRFVENVLELQNGEWFLDGSKDPQRLLFFLQSGDYDIRVIKMFRDGRAQSNSRREKPRNPVDFPGAVREWRSTIQQMEYVCSKLPSDNVFTLKYESLCEDPNGEVDQITRWLGLDPVDLDWTNFDLRTAEHHILGNRMRTRDRIEISLDQSWQDKVSADELAVFEKLAGACNRSLGY